MALFELNSDITIGNFRFSGVHDVKIKRSIHSYADSATITIPHIARIVSKSHSFPQTTVLRTLINDGDAVTINLGYNGVLNEEFRGFVKRRGRGIPMIVECEGYVRKLRLNVDYTSGSEKAPVTTTAKKLLTAMLEKTGITLQMQDDFNISNFWCLHADGTRICDFIKQASDGTLTIFFIKPDVLWCGLVYTPYAAGGDPSLVGGTTPKVNYRLGFNCIKDNGLKEKTPSEPTRIILNGKLASGTVVWTKSKNKQATKKYVKLLNNVPDNKTLSSFAQEKEYEINYKGMEGYVNGFLVPYALPGYDAYVIDTDDPDLNGTYLIEGTEVSFGISGARRKVQIGPLVNFEG